jgi:hypothetical protein
MSFYIDATTPDLQGFDPSQSGNPLPPVGVYPNLVLQVVTTKQGETTNHEPKFDITYEIMSGALTGTQFSLTYNTGNRNPDTAKWAVQDIMRVTYGITGENYTGRRFEFNEKMYYKPFNATLTITEKPGKDKNGNTTDATGKPIVFKNGKLTAIKPMDNAAPNHAPVGQPQQAYEPAGQPQTAAGTPPWGPR